MACKISGNHSFSVNSFVNFRCITPCSELRNQQWCFVLGIQARDRDLFFLLCLLDLSDLDILVPAEPLLKFLLGP